jgi:hypothetical protein
MFDSLQRRVSNSKRGSGRVTRYETFSDVKETRTNEKSISIKSKAACIIYRSIAKKRRATRGRTTLSYLIALSPASWPSPDGRRERQREREREAGLQIRSRPRRTATGRPGTDRTACMVAYAPSATHLRQGRDRAGE